MSAMEVSRELRWHKSTASRLLAAMQETGLLQRGEDRTYRLGVYLARIGVLAQSSASLGVAQPILDRLARDTGETANLAVMSGGEVVDVALAPSPQPIKHVGWIGRQMPIHATAGGKALIAFAPPDEFRRILDRRLTRYTSHTITAPAELRQQIRSIRARRTSIAWGEFEKDLVAVAAPVFDHSGRVIAAVTVSGPMFRVSESRILDIEQKVRDAASALSRMLGYSDPAADGPADPH